MKKRLSVLALIASMMTASTALAAERTVTFAVDNMTCASCPYIVKTSMAAVPGVSTVAVSFEAKTATVTFDEAKTNPARRRKTTTSLRSWNPPGRSSWCAKSRMSKNGIAPLVESRRSWY